MQLTHDVLSSHLFEGHSILSYGAVLKLKLALKPSLRFRNLVQLSPFHSQVVLKSKQLSEDIVLDKFNALRNDYRMPQYPIVLCHGFFGFDQLLILPNPSTVKRKLLSWFGYEQPQGKSDVQYAAEDYKLWEYFKGVGKELRARGLTVLIARVPPFGTVEERAQVLNGFITANLGEGTKVNLIAHSMGGLDCRYLISRVEDKKFEVASLTTVSTPHHGSSIADIIVQNVPLPKVPGNTIYQLSQEYCDTEFNPETPDDPRVLYFSYGSRCKPSWTNPFYYPWKLLKQKEGPNDGMVSCQSARWGQYMGTIENVDHLELLNWKVKEDFNAMALYLEIMDTLNKKGL
ncbi:unnamed protein product [Kuraishia capsulata CBS 1993]|uniref:DUF676 domain-containing protein n=1 Tax=Kuraishia capsulata CBS 1993 TaxID=1382522 RepID=W6MJZ4_9ASCO|nr:uncharacterized protein KUCA_T00002838001 [Kuraishia capsulata CBS 1993]CDK26864.1 unnamed protein product [Kuraishia capsulata CBS 1993]